MSFQWNKRYFQGDVAEIMDIPGKNSAIIFFIRVLFLQWDTTTHYFLSPRNLFETHLQRNDIDLLKNANADEVVFAHPLERYLKWFMYFLFTDHRTSNII